MAFNALKFAEHGLADEWWELVRDLIQECTAARDFMKPFADLKTDEERVTLLHQLISTHPEKVSAPGLAVFDGKCSATSIKHRNDGNKLFQKKNNNEALFCYNASVAYAPSNSEELSLAIANRSAVLFELGEYEKCNSDISMAISCGYPEKSLYKLYLRKGKCMKRQGNYADAKFALRKAAETLKVADLNEKRKVAIHEEVEKLITQCSTDKALDDQQQKIEKEDKRGHQQKHPF
jgi:tetratricopeptide (TPR) repeat protein